VELLQSFEERRLVVLGTPADRLSTDRGIEEIELARMISTTAASLRTRSACRVCSTSCASIVARRSRTSRCWSPWTRARGIWVSFPRQRLA
jgi:hypothetical protein